MFTFDSAQSIATCEPQSTTTNTSQSWASGAWAWSWFGLGLGLGPGLPSMASLFQFVLFLAIFITSSTRSISAIDNLLSTSAFSSRPSVSSSATISATATTAAPPAFNSLRADDLKPPPFSPFSSITPILTELGYHHLAMGAHSLSLSSTVIPWLGPVTIFAPADSSVRTCPSCSISLLLQEHTVPGLYPLDYLRRLLFGSKIETILAGRCLTVTSTANSSKIFIGGAEITRPNLFNNGLVIVHGLQGYISHLSPYSCSIDKMTSLSFPMQSPASSLMRLMLADAMIRLRTGGYSILALALRIKYPEIVTLNNMTIFALDDSAIFHGGSAYVHDVKFHMVPNCLLKLADLEALPATTVLPTLLPGETLMVTTAGGGGVLSPMRINYVRIKSPDLLYNLKIVVHGLTLPFSHLHQQATTAVSGQSGFGAIATEFGREDQYHAPLGKLGQSETGRSPVTESKVERDYHLGL
ncbi:hypothetical protein Cgig2_020072 [Carnegiea gigantea]|uniref:FAS1 domain-containing protein n=1 Tax=Carnegiea gigantea TaxID=171969 RepID=A0A9Q1QH31_9CARY|nr:hypothetical protein Cgig2_020072 [Carnegiea gigantea]